MRGWRALLVLLLLAGCTRAPEAERAAEGAETAAAPTRADLPVVVPRPVADLAVGLALHDTWIRPEDTVHANATGARSFEWYLATRNPLAAPPDPGPFTIAPGGSLTLGAREIGRHSFALADGSARLNASILPDAIALRFDVRLVEEDGALRFAPEEVVGGAGSVLRVSNDAGTIAVLDRTDAMLPLATSGASLAFRMPEGIELGDYDVVAVARDGSGAVGVATARLVYDNRKPDAQQEFGPFTGSFQLPGPAAGDPMRHAWTSAHPLRSLTLSLAVASESPAPASVRATLFGPGDAELGAIDASEWTLQDLPAGEYRIVVEPGEGALVRYEIDVRGEWILVPPASFFKNA